MLSSEPLRSIAITLALLFAAVGCTSTNNADVVATVSADQPLAMRVIDESSGFVDAAVEGILVLAGDCVSLQLEDDATVAVVWPDGMTRWDPGSQTVTMDRRFGETLTATIGDQIRMSGQQVKNADDFEWATKVALNCPQQLLLAS